MRQSEANVLIMWYNHLAVSWLGLHCALKVNSILRRDNAGNADIAAGWTELLESIGLGHLANEAIGGCCR
ncbi:hypothetical protein AB3M80_04725 [Arthrospira platensis BEA 1257B]